MSATAEVLPAPLPSKPAAAPAVSKAYGVTPIRNPFEAARSALIRRLVEMEVPRELSLRPRRDEFAHLADHIRDAANLFDEWLFAIGAEVAENANRAVDLRLFSGAFLGAVDGNATHATETAPYAFDSDEV
ncbi:hypothetical protein IC762_17535 [Bradyrhizobium genosp. L]|uniref:hypothetical protein n=1 Tax=Bradyrhizobium genosp. L TaxID=83637 RepID=UPI0018A26B3B|nr:hypothetical protein [Bradyrhizobium genosp. L]QPF81629.1 hypothetical protein IC762_17535 [Bradyrhizobium genosp. L]